MLTHPIARWLRRVAPSLLCLALLVAAVAPLSPAVAQDATPAEVDEPAPEPREPDPRLADPPTTIQTFIDAMYEWATNGAEGAPPEAAMVCCDFGPIPAGERRASAVGTLYNVLNKIGKVSDEEFDFDRIEGFTEEVWLFFPRDHQPTNRDELADTYGDVVRIELQRNELGEWRFSSRTMSNLAAMDRALAGEQRRAGLEVAVTLADRVRQLMPAKLKSGTFLTLEYWVWIVIFVVILAGVVVDFTVRTVLSSMWRQYERRRIAKSGDDEPSSVSDPKVLKRAVRPFGLFAGALVWYTAMYLGDLPPVAYQVLSTALHVVLSFAGVWAAWRVTDLLADFALKQTAKTETKIDDLLVPLVERSAKIFIFAMGLIYIANAFSIPILPLLSGLGIGGLAVAFAAKDTIENFFGSVAVILDRPFEVGDWIVVDDTEGTVEELGFRSTRIRTFYNSLVTVPNASLVRATVDNYGRRKYRRFRTMINVTYDTPPEKIEAFCEGIREIIRQHPYTRKDYYHVWLNAFGAHSLDILVYMFHECPDWAIELRERHRFMLDTIRLADRLGVEFAFPTQTLHVFQEQDGIEHTPKDAPQRSAERTAQRVGRRAARELTASQPWHDAPPGPVFFTTPTDDPEEQHET